MTESYNQQAIQQILQLAIARQHENGELMNRDQLLEIAAELSISPETLLAAEKEWLARQGEVQQKQDFDNYRRRKLRLNAEKYLIINTFLMLLNFLNSYSLSWSLYILIIWGLGLALNAWNTFKTDTEEYEKAFQNWQRKRQIGQSINTVLGKVFKS